MKDPGVVPARSLLASLLLCAIVAAGCGEGRPPGNRGEGKGRPNILVVTIDTLRADHVGCYGATFARTPTIDGLAAEGTRFENAFSPVPLTLPAHASMLTGKYPPGHGVRHNALFTLPEHEETMAEVLSRDGYRTGAVVGSMVLASHYGIAQGFETFDDKSAYKRSTMGGFFESKAEDVTDRAVSFLQQSAEPFFLWVHYYDPHQEYTPPRQYLDVFEDRPYDGEIAYVDDQLQRLLEYLRGQGRYERTLIVTTSDHGESLGEHHEETHGYTIYDAAMRIPLILSGPGVPAGVAVQNMVSLVDIAPTVYSLAGTAASAIGDGVDLSLTWAPGATSGAARSVYLEAISGSLDYGWSELHGARNSSYLFIRAPRPELYDATIDAAQLNNLLESVPAEEGLRRVVDEFESTIQARLSAETVIDRREIDAETRAQFEALGYVLSSRPRAATNVDPKDGILAKKVIRRAEDALGGGDVEGAKKLVRQVRELLPRSGTVVTLRARIALAEGRRDEALKLVEQAMNLPWPDERLKLLRAEILVNMDRADEALIDFERVIATNPYQERAHAGRLRIVVQKGDEGKAMQCEEEARKFAPANPEILLGMSYVWERFGNRERALSLVRDAIRVHPEYQDSRMHAAIQLVAIGRLEEAEGEMGKAGDAAADRVLLNRMGVAFAEQGEEQRAFDIFSELVRHYPDYESPRRNLELLENNSIQGEGR